MPKYHIAIDRTRIETFVKEGRGQGEGGTYKPWLTVRDVPSRGRSAREKGWKTDRTHHLLSNHELFTYYCLCWARQVRDIREQFPLLPIEETLALAEECGIKHPVHPKTQEPVVLTSDFLITLDYDGNRVEQVRTVKEVATLQSQRTLEKLELERRYWEARHIEWGIITEREIPLAVAKNVELLYEAYWFPSNTALSRKEITEITHTLTRLVAEKSQALRHITSACDRRLGFEPGTSLQAAYYLLATRQWQVDMFTPIDPSKPLVLLQMAPGEPC